MEKLSSQSSCFVGSALSGIGRFWFSLLFNKPSGCVVIKIRMPGADTTAGCSMKLA